MKLFRILATGESINNRKTPLLIQRGIFDSADDLIIYGDHNSIALVLANEGFNVWISNERGNKYSRVHKSKIPMKKGFWDYSFHEMGQFNIKANIKFILEKTGKSKITYTGLPEGITQLLSALETGVSEYLNSKLDKFIALVPVVFLED